MEGLHSSSSLTHADADNDRAAHDKAITHRADLSDSESNADDDHKFRKSRPSDHDLGSSRENFPPQDISDKLSSELDYVIATEKALLSKNSNSPHTSTTGKGAGKSSNNLVASSLTS